MPSSLPWLVVMLGGLGGTRLEELMRRALEASALDAIEGALATGRYAGAALLTDRPPLLDVPSGVEVDVDAPGAPFQYGQRLAGAITARGIEALAYLGGGSAPLLGAAEFEALALALDGGAVASPGAAQAVGISNNFYSADLFGIRPAALLLQLDPLPAKDNAVPRRLREEHGVSFEELPRSLATQTNLDTPIDLAALALSGRGGPRLRAVLADVPQPPRLAEAAKAFTDRLAEVLVAGRVASRAWQYLERETACRVRLLAEERGMAAAGREEDGRARSLLGMQIAAAGARRFFDEQLPQLCNAAFLDIRPALVHLGIRPSRQDRFAADLGLEAQIEEPRLRELVAAANASPVPVVLGGHTLVAGDLMLLNDWAWEQLDGQRRAASTAG